MLTDDEIRAALRPLYADDSAMEMALPLCISEARAIERAVMAAQQSADAQPAGWRITYNGHSFVTDRQQDADEAREEDDTAVEPLYARESADAMKIPTTADEAAAMMRVAAHWLEAHAPDVLRATMRGTADALDAAQQKWLLSCFCVRGLDIGGAPHLDVPKPRRDVRPDDPRGDQ